MRQRPALMPDFDGPSHDLPRLIEVLDRHEVEYLIVGGAPPMPMAPSVRPTTQTAW
jgi:hypothetical protein